MFAASARAGNRATRRDARAVRQRCRPRDPGAIDARQDRAMTLRIVSTAERPDLVPTVAGWVWGGFSRGHGHTLEQTIEFVAETVTARDLPQTYVLLADDRPVGTASLAARDLDERPDLRPWLAGVFVEPDSRGRGYAADL